jgi:ABC-2 type transport system ATP-binding protein
VTPNESAVLTEGLTKRFGAFTAVDHVDLRVEAGELYGFLGPNGAGKSTTLRMLCGILEPTEGSGRVLGIDLREEPERIKAAIGYMSQRFSLYDDLSAAENLIFYSMVYGVPGRLRRERIDRMVQLADLVRQRLALACALVHSPKLMFLDEPTAGVDPVSRRTFWELIRRLADSGVTILVTTHYMDEAEHCDRLGFIYQGRLIAQGTPAAIKTEAFGRPVLEVETPAPQRAIDVLSEWPVVEEAIRFGSLVRVVAAERDLTETGVVEHLRDAGIDASVRRVAPTIEDVFISFVDKDRKLRLRKQLGAF